MDRLEKLTRRTVVTAISVCGLACKLWALPSPGHYSLEGPVLHVTYVSTETEAVALVVKLRKRPGCLKVDAFAGSDGRFAIFHTWVSQNASTRFWEERAVDAAGMSFARLEI